MVQVQRHLNPKLVQYPHWWKNPAQVTIVSSLRANGRGAWEIAQAEKALQIARITSFSFTGAPPPSKIEYRIIRKQTANIRVEPTYVAGVIPPTNLMGAIGIDQFKQRHLAPPWYMDREQIRQLLQWEPIVIPPATVTVGGIQHTLHKAPPSMDLRKLCALS